MNIQEKLKQIITDELCGNVPEINMASDLIYDIGFDELDLVEIAMSIEEALDIEIDFEDHDPSGLSKVKTFGDLVELVEKIIKQKEAL